MAPSSACTAAWWAVMLTLTVLVVLDDLNEWAIALALAGGLYLEFFKKREEEG